MFVLPENLHVEIPVLSVMVLEGGAFGRCLGREGGALVNGIGFS